jgi:UDP-4-amino-4,6-dideoxy-N-acetyl-beta-L-altrosamine transaminase
VTHAFLPYGRQSIDQADVEAVTRALRSDFLTTGPLVHEFETAFASACGGAYAVASNSGTAALHLAALALQLGPGDSAIVPSVTFLATANAVRMTGADVFFADVDPDTGLLTPATLRVALQRSRRSGVRVRAVFPVHLNGQICDLVGLRNVAGDDIALVEDACHALGEADVGACVHSVAACFSTHAVKAIATGEGGVTITANSILAERMRALRSHGMVRDPTLLEQKSLAYDDGVRNPWYYEMPGFGWNYRMPDVLCALGLSQLSKLPKFAARRREIAATYDRLLAPLAPVIRPVPHAGRHGWHLYVLLVDFGALRMSRRVVMERLQSEGIGTQVHYIPVHLQPYYRKLYGALSLPGAECYYSRCLSIPFYPALKEDDTMRVEQALRRLVEAGVGARYDK